MELKEKFELVKRALKRDTLPILTFADETNMILSERSKRKLKIMYQYFSILELSQLYKVPYSYMRLLLKRNGIPMRRRGQKIIRMRLYAAP